MAQRADRHIQAHTSDIMSQGEQLRKRELPPLCAGTSLLREHGHDMVAQIKKASKWMARMTPPIPLQLNTHSFRSTPPTRDAGDAGAQRHGGPSGSRGAWRRSRRSSGAEGGACWYRAAGCADAAWRSLGCPCLEILLVGYIILHTVWGT